MSETVKFSSSIELGTQYSVTGISNTETDAIVAFASPSSVVAPSGNTQSTLYINYNAASLTHCYIRVYDSYVAVPTATDWYSEVIESDAANGSATLAKFLIDLTGSGQLAYHIPIGAVNAMKVTVQSVGTTTNSSITLNWAFRNN